MQTGGVHRLRNHQTTKNQQKVQLFYLYIIRTLIQPTGKEHSLSYPPFVHILQWAFPYEPHLFSVQAAQYPKFTTERYGQ